MAVKWHIQLIGSNKWISMLMLWSVFLVERNKCEIYYIWKALTPKYINVSDKWQLQNGQGQSQDQYVLRWQSLIQSILWILATFLEECMYLSFLVLFLLEDKIIRRFIILVLRDKIRKLWDHKVLNTELNDIARCT